MKTKLILIIIFNLILQHTYGQKINWDKPLYEIKFKSGIYDIKNKKFNVDDITITYIYHGDTTITYYENGNIEKNKKVNNNITEEWIRNGEYKQFSYDSLGSLTQTIIIWNPGKYPTEADTVKFTNTYDDKKRLTRTIGSDQSNITFKYKKNTKTEATLTTGKHSLKKYYYKDPEMKYDTLIIEYLTTKEIAYTHTQYDSLNRKITMEYEIEHQTEGTTWNNRTTFFYTDNIAYITFREFDLKEEYGIIYKKEDE